MCELFWGHSCSGAEDGWMSGSLDIGYPTERRVRGQVVDEIRELFGGGKFCNGGQIYPRSYVSFVDFEVRGDVK